jgi:hypothetical protein
MVQETLRVTWKLIRREGYGRTKQTYCTYIAENKNHKHKLKTLEGSKLFEILEKTIVSDNDRYSSLSVFIDAYYVKKRLIYITNFRVM